MSNGTAGTVVGTIVRLLQLIDAVACAAAWELKPDSPKQGDAIRVTCAGDLVSARLAGETARFTRSRALRDDRQLSPCRP